LAVVSVVIGARGAFTMPDCRFFDSLDLTAATRRRFAGISSSSRWTRVAGGSGEMERPRFEERRRMLAVESEDNGASDDCSGFAMPDWTRRRLAGASSSSQVARGAGETERTRLEDRRRILTVLSVDIGTKIRCENRRGVVFVVIKECRQGIVLSRQLEMTYVSLLRVRCMYLQS
jgi:hypothetical protein